MIDDDCQMLLSGLSELLTQAIFSWNSLHYIAMRSRTLPVVELCLIDC